MNRWLVECAELFVSTRENYQSVLPSRGIETSQYQIVKFFNCVAAYMSRKLRQIVFKSLRHFMDYLRDYKVNNENHFYKTILL